MRFPTLIALLTLSAALPAVGQTIPQTAQPEIPAPLTLDDALRIALQNQNLIGIARSQQTAAEARVTQARSAYFPRITPSYNYSNQRTAFNTGEGTRTGTITQNNATVDLTQTLFDSGSRQQNVARSKDSLRSATYNVVDVRQDVILTVTTDWYELLRSKELVRVAESGASRAKTTLDATTAFAEAGSVARKDVLQAQADYDNAQVQVLQARNTLRLAGTALKNAMGVVTSAPIDTADTPPPAPPETPDQSDVTNYVQQAFSRRPDLKSAEATISASRHGASLARIEAGPQISSTLSAGYRIHPDPGTDRALLVGVSYPLFDAGAARAAVREAKAGVTQAEESLELERQNIAADVESAWLSREEARARLAVTRTALAAAQENYAAASESQREGAGTILDVITAQNLLVTSETNAVQAIYDYYDADARLQRAIGSNDTGLAEANPT
jgi:outer membrane protein